jgi:dipeptidase
MATNNATARGTQRKMIPVEKKRQKEEYKASIYYRQTNTFDLPQNSPRRQKKYDVTKQFGIIRTVSVPSLQSPRLSSTDCLSGPVRRT